MKLIEAIKQNDQKEFFRLLNLKINNSGKRFIDEVDTEYGGSPLSRAAALGYVHFIQPLLKAGADINKQDKNGKTPVYEAAEGGHSSVITVLHAARADVNKSNRNGETPVYIAAKNGHTLAIAALHAAGANIDTPNKNGKTPIYAASQENHIEAVTALKTSGASMNILVKGGIKHLYTAEDISKIKKRDITNNSTNFSKLFLGLSMAENPDLKSLKEEEYQSLVEKNIENENINSALTEVGIATENSIKTWGENLAKPLKVLMSCCYTSLNKSDYFVAEGGNELTVIETELLKMAESFNMEVLNVTHNTSEERELLSFAGIEEEELNSIVHLDSPASGTRDQKFDSLNAFGLQQRRSQEKPITDKVVGELELEDDQDVIRRKLNQDAINRAQSLGRYRTPVVS